MKMKGWQAKEGEMEGVGGGCGGRGWVAEKKLIKPTKWPLPSDGERLIFVYLFILFHFP